MTIKKIQLNSEERELLRRLLNNEMEENQTGLINREFTESGIVKITDQLVVIGRLLEKISFPVLK